MLHKKVNAILKVLMTGSSEVTVVRRTPKSEIPQSSKWLTRGDGGAMMLWSVVTLLGNLNEVQSQWVWAQPGWAQWSGGGTNWATLESRIQELMNTQSGQKERQRERKREAPQAALGAHKPPTQNTPRAQAKKVTNAQTHKGRQRQGGIRHFHQL